MRNTVTIATTASLITILSLFLPPRTPAKDARSSLVRVPYKSPAQVKMLFDRGIDVIHFSPRGYIDVAAYPSDIDYLFSLGYEVSIIATPDMSLSSPALDQHLGLYHTYAEMESTLLALQSLHPALAQVDILGSSHEGRSIYSIKISDNVGTDEAEPEVLIMGNHHARELMAVEVPLKFAEYLLENYGSDSTVSYLVDNREIFIVPMVNPDGHVYVELNHSGPWWYWWRKNRRDNGDDYFGVDLNRNYGHMWGYDDYGSSPYTSSEIYRGPAPFSEPECQAIRNLAQERSFVLGFSYHSYGELLLYPWGYNFSYTPDHDLFFALGDSLTFTNGYYQGNTAMGAIYVTNGDTDDWAYGDDVNKNPFFCFTPEINSGSEGGFAPPDTLIEPTFDFLLPMNLLMVDLADNPRRILGPMTFTMYSIDTSPYGSYILSWSSSIPSDPNPAITYDVIEYKNFISVIDRSDTLSNLWDFDGFSLGARAYEGFASYYSNTGNYLSSTITTASPFPVTTDNDTLTCWVWYDIESDYDYAYLEASTDDGLTWETVAGNITTNFNPYGANHGNGITGTGEGWTQADFHLDNYIGTDVTLRFHYITDGALYNEGFYVDLIDPVPTYENLSVIGSAISDTSLVVVPQEVGKFSYKVRGRDADGQLSRWSATVSTTVDELVGAQIDPVLASWLGSNYPNPFNPQTTIPYQVGGNRDEESKVHVSLAIYGVTGKLVIKLVDGLSTPGTYYALWDGRNNKGVEVSSGIYFARLVVGGRESFTRKLVLLK